MKDLHNVSGVCYTDSPCLSLLSDLGCECSKRRESHVSQHIRQLFFLAMYICARSIKEDNAMCFTPVQELDEIEAVSGLMQQKICIISLEAPSAAPYSLNMTCLTSQQVLLSAHQSTVPTVATWDCATLV